MLITDRDPIAERRRLLRRGLRLVVIWDATSCVALIVVALGTRSRRSAPVYSAIARAAVASFLPGAIAVLRELHAHRAPPTRRHRMMPTVLLVGAGAVIDTAGTIDVLARIAPEHGSTTTSVASTSHCCSPGTRSASRTCF